MSIRIHMMPHSATSEKKVHAVIPHGDYCSTRPEKPIKKSGVLRLRIFSFIAAPAASRYLNSQAYVLRLLLCMSHSRSMC
ncbi:hypothetical protein DFO73_11150 [Cytobacillus oceanisediminis]|uniref:Uncharacterized protein n=1 Tax=Cytobacillus oceanisediminis TaxID=665099 RepID=A0A2V2ZY11_9BACI|nr:hypothetical protein DFO73_11150 [Cytobacillus oceanisediminis]